MTRQFQHCDIHSFVHGHVAFRISSIILKAISRHRLLVVTLKLYVNIITVSILFTIPHLIVLYTWTIMPTCCMHTHMSTASRSFDRRRHRHLLHIIHHRIIMANHSINARGGDRCLLKLEVSNQLTYLNALLISCLLAFLLVCLLTSLRTLTNYYLLYSLTCLRIQISRAFK